ncbi:MAG: hypothetical protein JWO19_4655 [Bryobacterales bacterium]|nr:hypothetical protein [Bryobacterales bacterium]
MKRLPLLLLLGVNYAAAQQTVPVTREPHHHVVYEDARVRILDVQIEPRGSTLLHRHDTDYVSVAASGISFSRGGITHVERNENDRVSSEVMIELLQQQTNPHNVCGEVLQGEYAHCREPGAEWLGANLQIQFETDQTRVGILQITPGATLAIPPADVPPLLIALEGTEAEAVTRANGAPTGSGSRRSLKAADVLRSPVDQVSEIRNIGKTTARFLVVEFGGPGE